MGIYEVEYTVTRKIEVPSENSELAKKFVEQMVGDKRNISFVSIIRK